MRLAFAASLAFIFAGFSFAQPSDSASDTRLTASVIIEAFAKSSGGFSSDEVLLEDSRRKKFLAAVAKRLNGGGNASEVSENEAAELSKALEGQACAMLLKLRKAGKLTVKATKRGKSADPSVLPIAEIAARTISEKFDVSTDAIIADPKLREAFDVAARQVDPEVSLYDARKAALQLRKSRRLKPELVLRVADWEKDVQVHPLTFVRDNLKQVPTKPGIYLFRDATGYIYIGEAVNLRNRLTQHLTDSDRKSLARYIEDTAGEGLSIEWHAFPSDSPAKQVAVRRAYESELIRSRKPRLNVRP